VVSEIHHDRARRLLSTACVSQQSGNNHMKKSKIPPAKLSEWIEFCWLYVASPVFRAAPNKRKAYFEHRLGKIYNLPCF
jgi:hypothetical protein